LELSRLSLEREPPLLRVWLDRPERRNALDGRTLAEIEAVFAGLASDYETRVVILGGRGPSFCAGADRKHPPGSERMRAASGASARERRHTAQLGLRAARAVERAEALTVARVQGHAVGGGFVLALACDFRVAALDASFHVPEVELGVPLTWGGVPRLIQEVGAARAREILLLCDAFDGRRAEALGVVQRAVAADALDAEVEALARRLSALPEVAVHMTKTQLRAYAARASLGDVTESDGDLLLEASRSGRARESFRADDPLEGPDD
jgi:enoyl-CoA hydratase/carnithine racemase